MNSKMLLAALVTAVASFLIGWVVWGMLLNSYFVSHTNPEVMRPMDHMNFLAMILANLFWGTTTAWVLWRMGVSSAMAGIMPGAVLAGLMACGTDMFNLAMTWMYTNTTVIIIDVIATAIVGGVLGAVAGWVLGMGNKSGAAATA